MSDSWTRLFKLAERRRDRDLEEAKANIDEGEEAVADEANALSKSSDIAEIVETILMTVGAIGVLLISISLIVQYFAPESNAPESSKSQLAEGLFLGLGVELFSNAVVLIVMYRWVKDAPRKIVWVRRAAISETKLQSGQKLSRSVCCILEEPQFQQSSERDSAGVNCFLEVPALMSAGDEETVTVPGLCVTALVGVTSQRSLCSDPKSRDLTASAAATPSRTAWRA